MKAAKNFQDLIVWQKAHKFVLAVYKITKDFPKEEMYGLTSQYLDERLYQYLRILQKGLIEEVSLTSVDL
jgi:hypothetical protein